MAKYTGSVCKLCRREGEKLFLKGRRCLGEKCSLDRRGSLSGRGFRGRRVRVSKYGLQLREKQKLRRIYGVLEKQFRLYFGMAEREKGITGENLLRLLERRLDNVVYRLGLASSRREARELICHRHFLVNGRKVTRPSYLVKIGEVVALSEGSKGADNFKESLELAKERGSPPWMEVDTTNLKGTITRFPSREEMPISIQEKLIIELYSK